MVVEERLQLRPLHRAQEDHTFGRLDEGEDAQLGARFGAEQVAQVAVGALAEDEEEVALHEVLHEDAVAGGAGGEDRGQVGQLGKREEKLKT